MCRAVRHLNNMCYNRFAGKAWKAAFFYEVSDEALLLAEIMGCESASNFIKDALLKVRICAEDYQKGTYLSKKGDLLRSGGKVVLPEPDNRQA